MNLVQFLNDNGFDFNPIFDDTIRRFKGQSRKSKSGWYIGKKFPDDTQFLIVGDWATGEKPLKWCSKKSTLKTKEFTQFVKQAQIKRAEEAAKTNEQIAEDAFAMACKTLPSPEKFEYLEKKQIPNAHSLFGSDHHGPHLTIPMMDVDGKIWSIQKIYENGRKYFLQGGKKKGCFWRIGEYTPISTLYIVEGFATGVSVHQAIGEPVYVAFDSGNLFSVAEALKSRFKNEIIIAADNDQYGESNAGIDAAVEIKKKLGIDFIYPTFEDVKSKPTDFNDLMILQGIDEVKKQILKIKEDEVQEPAPKKEMSESDEYDAFVEIFEDLLPDARKCPLNGTTYRKINGIWQDVLIELPLLRAEARIRELPKHLTDDFLMRWMQSLEPKWLCDFETWEGQDFIGSALASLVPSNVSYDHFFELMKEWFATIFKRVEDNRIQNKMVILHGAQGVGKDTWIANLFESLNPYFANIMLFKNREQDTYQSMSRHLVLNISEFEQSAKFEVAQIKNMITTPGATFRPPYGRAPVTNKFHTSFISSCNYSDIFRDESGNRRFLYFELADIRWDYPTNKSGQIIAQARHLASIDYKASEGAKEAMRKVLEEKTPDSIYDMIENDWNIKMTQRSRLSPKLRWIYQDVSSTILEIAHMHSVKPKFVMQVLKTKNMTRKDKSGYYYTFLKTGLQETGGDTLVTRLSDGLSI